MLSIQLGKQIGEGVFGSVYECTLKDNTTKYAIKVSKTERHNKSLQKEDILLRYLEWSAQGDDQGLIKRYGFTTLSDKKIGVVLELLGVSLKGCSAPLKGIQRITQQLAGALAFIHKAGVIHADIKPENILLSLDKTHVKIVDFGLSFFKATGYTPEHQIQTLWYRSPEVILTMEEYTPAIDIWSCAATIVEIYMNSKIHMVNAVFKVDPRRKDSIRQEIELIAYHHQRLKKFYPAELVDQGSAAGKWQYEKSAQVRIPIEDSLSRLLEKKALANQESEKENALFLDLLEKMFVYEPTDRITAQDILEHSFLEALCKTKDTNTESLRVELHGEELRDDCYNKRHKEFGFK